MKLNERTEYSKHFFPQFDAALKKIASQFETLKIIPIKRNLPSGGMGRNILIKFKSGKQMTAEIISGMDHFDREVWLTIKNSPTEDFFNGVAVNKHKGKKKLSKEVKITKRGNSGYSTPDYDRAIKEILGYLTNEKYASKKEDTAPKEVEKSSLIQKGSSMADIERIQGKPTDAHGSGKKIGGKFRKVDVWEYGKSQIILFKGKVIGWTNKGNLKVNGPKNLEVENTMKISKARLREIIKEEIQIAEKVSSQADVLISDKKGGYKKEKVKVLDTFEIFGHTVMVHKSIGEKGYAASHYGTGMAIAKAPSADRAKTKAITNLQHISNYGNKPEKVTKVFEDALKKYGEVNKGGSIKSDNTPIPTSSEPESTPEKEKGFGSRQWNKIIDAVNNAWGATQPGRRSRELGIMMRTRKDGRHHIQRVNTFWEYPKELINFVKSIPGSEIDERNRLIILPDDAAWAKLYKFALKAKKEREKEEKLRQASVNKIRR